MPPETIILEFDDGSHEQVVVELEEVPIGGAGGMSTTLKVANMGISSPLRAAAEKTLRPSGPIGVTISARTARIANAVLDSLRTAGGKHKPNMRIAPNLPPI